MIVEIPQLISCFISTKSEILLDHAAPWARAPRVGPRTAHTVTTHHLNQRHWLLGGEVAAIRSPARWR
jgi:hypothetical protein